VCAGEGSEGDCDVVHEKDCTPRNRRVVLAHIFGGGNQEVWDLGWRIVRGYLDDHFSLPKESIRLKANG
jgi:hypothetical protein